jgi:hypothetical protein
VEDDDVCEFGWDLEGPAAGEVEVERWVGGGWGRCVGGGGRSWGEVAPCFGVFCVGCGVLDGEEGKGRGDSLPWR